MVDNVSDSRSQMSSGTLAKAWNKLWPLTEASDDSAGEATVDLSKEISSAFGIATNEAVEWLNCDEKDEGYEMLTDDQIVEQFAEGGENVDETDDYDGGDKKTAASAAKDLRSEAKDASHSIQKFIDWFQEQEEATMMQTMQLRKFRLIAEQKSKIIEKQSKMTDFFKRNK